MKAKIRAATMFSTSLKRRRRVESEPDSPNNSGSRANNLNTSLQTVSSIVENSLGKPLEEERWASYFDYSADFGTYSNMEDTIFGKLPVLK